MLLALETVRLYEVDRVDHVEVCYPTWMHPADVNASIISYDGSKLVFEIGQNFCIRLNKDNNLFFKVVGEQFMPIDPTTTNVGSCATLKTASLTEYNRRVLVNLFPGANVYDNELLLKAREHYGSLFTSYLNTQLLFVDRPEDEDYDDAVVIAQGDYLYDVTHNIVYYPPEKQEEINKLHKRLHALYGVDFPSTPLYLNKVMEIFE